MWVAKGKLSSAFLQKERRYVLPDYKIRYREHTTESSFRLGSSAVFYYFYFAFFSFMNRRVISTNPYRGSTANGYACPSGMALHYDDVPCINGSVRIEFTQNKWFACVECMDIWKLYYLKRPTGQFPNEVLFFWLGTANFPHTYRVLGAWDILLTLTCMWANVHLESSCLLMTCCQVLEYDTVLRRYFSVTQDLSKLSTQLHWALVGLNWKTNKQKTEHFSVPGASFLMRAGTADPKGESKGSLPSS